MLVCKFVCASVRTAVTCNNMELTALALYLGELSLNYYVNRCIFIFSHIKEIGYKLVLLQ